MFHMYFYSKWKKQATFLFFFFKQIPFYTVKISWQRKHFQSNNMPSFTHPSVFLNSPRGSRRVTSPGRSLKVLWVQVALAADNVTGASPAPGPCTDWGYVPLSKRRGGERGRPSRHSQLQSWMSAAGRGWRSGERPACSDFTAAQEKKEALWDRGWVGGRGCRILTRP